MNEPNAPLLLAEDLTKYYGRQLGCRDVSFELYEGEVIAVVGESGSGKSTLLQLLCCQIEASAGRVLYSMRDGVTRDLATLSEAERRFLARTDWGYVHQAATLGLRSVPEEIRVVPLAIRVVRIGDDGLERRIPAHANSSSTKASSERRSITGSSRAAATKPGG